MGCGRGLIGLQVKKLRKHFPSVKRKWSASGRAVAGTSESDWLCRCAWLGDNGRRQCFDASRSSSWTVSIAGSGEASFLIKAPNDETLGRVAPLKMADAARTDFPDNLVKS